MNCLKSLRLRRLLIWLLTVVVSLAVLGGLIYRWQCSTEEAFAQAREEMERTPFPNNETPFQKSKYLPDCVVNCANHWYNKVNDCKDVVQHKISTFPKYAEAWSVAQSAKFCFMVYLIFAALILLKVLLGVVSRIFNGWLDGTLMPVSDLAVEVLPNGDVVIHISQLQKDNPSKGNPSVKLLQ